MKICKYLKSFNWGQNWMSNKWMKPQNKGMTQNIKIQVLYDCMNVNNRGIDSKWNDFNIQFPNIFVIVYLFFLFSKYGASE